MSLPNYEDPENLWAIKLNTVMGDSESLLWLLRVKSGYHTLDIPPTLVLQIQIAPKRTWTVSYSFTRLTTKRSLTIHKQHLRPCPYLYLPHLTFDPIMGYEHLGPGDPNPWQASSRHCSFELFEAF